MISAIGGASRSRFASAAQAQPVVQTLQGKLLRFGAKTKLEVARTLEFRDLCDRPVKPSEDPKRNLTVADCLHHLVKHPSQTIHEMAIGFVSFHKSDLSAALHTLARAGYLNSVQNSQYTLTKDTKALLKKEYPLKRDKPPATEGALALYLKH
jgi:hypothetical protein